MRIGPYEVVQEIARGANGVVYEARDAQPGRTVALKVLAGSGEVQRERFFREARTLSAIQHPNVVRVFAAGEDQGLPWISMELVAGESLQDRLERFGPFDVRAYLAEHLSH